MHVFAHSRRKKQTAKEKQLDFFLNQEWVTLNVFDSENYEPSKKRLTFIYIYSFYSRPEQNTRTTMHVFVNYYSNTG